MYFIVLVLPSPQHTCLWLLRPSFLCDWTCTHQRTSHGAHPFARGVEEHSRWTPTSVVWWRTWPLCLAVRHLGGPSQLSEHRCHLAFGFEGKRTVCDVKVNRVLGAAFNIIYSTTISQRPFPRVDYPSWVRDPLQGNKMLLQH